MKKADLKKLEKEIMSQAADAAKQAAIKNKYSVECPHCGKKVTVPVGKSKCPKCREEIDLTLDFQF